MAIRFPIAPADVPQALSKVGGQVGSRITIEEVGEFVLSYWDGAAPATLQRGDWVFLAAVASVEGRTPRITAAATTAVEQDSGVVMATRTTAGLVWVQVRGYCNVAKFDGTAAIAAGSPLQLANGSVYAVTDGGANAARTSDTVAIALVAEARTPAAQLAAGEQLDTKRCYIIGRPIIIG